LPVLERERVGQVRKRISFGLIVIGVIGGFFIAFAPGRRALMPS